MPFQLAAIVIGLIVGWIRKGSIWSLTNLRLKWLWTLPVAYLLQIISINYLNGSIYQLMLVVSYLILIIFSVRNLIVPGVVWALAGTVANFLVMAINGLRMPAYMEPIKALSPQMVTLLQHGQYGKSIAMGQSTHLNFLGDIFFVKIQPPALVSIGDILFSIGIAVLIQHAMRVGRGISKNA